MYTKRQWGRKKDPDCLFKWRNENGIWNIYNYIYRPGWMLINQCLQYSSTWWGKYEWSFKMVTRSKLERGQLSFSCGHTIDRDEAWGHSCLHAEELFWLILDPIMDANDVYISTHNFIIYSFLHLSLKYWSWMSVP